MTQDRNLVPRSVYLPLDVVVEAENRAGDLGIPVATLLRLIILGKQDPIDVPSG